MHGGEALRRQLDVKASALGRASGVKGWNAQLRYLTRSERGRIRSSEQFGRRNLIAWLGEDRDPTKANREMIQRAYDERRRPAIAQALLKSLDNDGNGSQVDVYPLDDDVHTAHLDMQTIEVTEWEDIIQAWYEHDWDELDGIWEETSDAELYPAGGYYYVSHLGF